MSPDVILFRVLLGSIFLVGMISGQAATHRRGFTSVPNSIIDALIHALNRQTGTGNVNRRELGRGLAPEEINPLPRAIDEIIEDAESGFPEIRLANQLKLQREGRVVIEGDIVMDQSELADMDKQIRLDRLEEQMLRNLPAARQNDTVFRDRLRAMLERRENTSPVRRKRAARRDRRWPNALVNVRIASSGFSISQKKRIAASMNEISEKTCVCFNVISRTQALQGVEHVRIIDGDGCKSRVGRILSDQDGTISQDLSLAQGCRSTRVATHEFLHALGLHHEQSRPDRYRFVRILLWNVEPDKRGNFRRISRKTIDSLGLSYDYFSIMHYSSRAWSINDRFTIIPTGTNRRYINRIGRSTVMSSNDAEVIRRMYSCPGVPISSQTSTPPVRPRSSCSGYPYSFPSFPEV